MNTACRILTLSAPGGDFPVLHRGSADATVSAVLVPGWGEPRSGHSYLHSRLAEEALSADPALEVWQFDPAGQGESTQTFAFERWQQQLEAVLAACAGRPWILTRGISAFLLEPWIPVQTRGIAINPPNCQLPMPASARERCSRLGGEWAVAPDTALVDNAFASMMETGGKHRAHLVLSSADWTVESLHVAAVHRRLRGGLLPASASDLSELTEILGADLKEFSC